MHDKDFQKNRVYDWEAKHIARNDKIPFKQAQSLVNYIWEQEGLKYPPVVEELDIRTTRFAGKADRLTVYLPTVTSTAVIIHELAHSMTADFDNTCAHGPWFVGVYIKLLAKYAGYSLSVLLYTLTLHNVQCNINAYPVFLD